MRTILLMIFFFIKSYTFSQSISKIDSLELWTYTIGNFIDENAHRIVSEKWPFKIKPYAGDVIDELLVEKIEEHNKEIWDTLESIGYIDPEKRYYFAVEKEKNNIQKVVSLINNHPKFLKLKKDIKNKGLIEYFELSKLNEKKYQLLVYSFDIRIKKEEKMDTKFIVNIQKNKVKVCH